MVDQPTSQTQQPATSDQSSSSAAPPQPSTGTNTPATTSAAPIPSSPAPATPSRPAYIPETHWDAQGGKVKDEAAFAKFINDHVAFKAADDSRRLTLPAKPEDYKLELPKDFKAPQGIEFKLNDQDPLLPQARAFAHKYGLPQEAFQDLLSLDAASKIGSQQNIDTAKAAEVAKLGVNGTARKTAVDTWLKAELGDDLGAEMSRFTFTAKQIEGIEKLMAKARTQGGTGPGVPHREPPDAPGKVSDEEYGRMSFTERQAYAARFPQPVANGHA